MEERAVIRYGVRDEESILVPLAKSYDLIRCIVTEPPMPLELHIHTPLLDQPIVIPSNKYHIIAFSTPLPLLCMKFVDMDCKVYVDEDEQQPKIAVYGCYLQAEERLELTSKPYVMPLEDGRTLYINGDVALHTP